MGCESFFIDFLLFKYYLNFLTWEVLNYIIVVQIDDLLSRLDSGENIETIIKEERRRLKKKEMKKMDKNKKLKLLEKKASFFLQFLLSFCKKKILNKFIPSEIYFPFTWKGKVYKGTGNANSNNLSTWQEWYAGVYSLENENIFLIVA